MVFVGLYLFLCDTFCRRDRDDVLHQIGDNIMTHCDAFDGHSAMTTEPIVRLWLFRMLVPLRGVLPRFRGRFRTES